MSPTLSISQLNISFGKRMIFKEIDLDVRRGESVVILGSSGSGKSTLLSAILGLVKPDSGSIRVSESDIVSLPGSALASLRSSEIGMVFQFGELLPELTPIENVAIAALLAGKTDSSVYGKAQILLEQLGVPQGEDITILSGGERQRVAVARALMNDPGLVLADEPTGALDEDNRYKVGSLLFSLPRERDCALVVATHDHGIARMADRVLEIKDSNLVTAKDF